MPKDGKVIKCIFDLLNFVFLQVVLYHKMTTTTIIHVYFKWRNFDCFQDGDDLMLWILLINLMYLVGSLKASKGESHSLLCILFSLFTLFLYLIHECKKWRFMFLMKYVFSPFRLLCFENFHLYSVLVNGGSSPFSPFLNQALFFSCIFNLQNNSVL